MWPVDKKVVLLGVGILAIVLGFLVFGSKEKATSTQSLSSNTSKQAENKLTAVSTITHGHGLAVDVDDPSKVYIATHHGLLVLISDKDLYQVGSSKDDYMGFSPHPTDAKVFFASGHPVQGGNIGFQKSEDSGITWKKVSNGLEGPVDFHAMAVSGANPLLVYGYYKSALQRSSDGGNNWEIVGRPNFQIISLVTDPQNENVVYAASPQGLMVSRNKGSEWEELTEGAVVALAIDPQNTKQMVLSSQNQGLSKSSDGGQSWEKVNEGFAGEEPVFISFSKKNSATVYLLTEKNSIYKSIDNAVSWSKVR